MAGLVHDIELEDSDLDIILSALEFDLGEYDYKGSEYTAPIIETLQKIIDSRNEYESESAKRSTRYTTTG